MDLTNVISIEICFLFIIIIIISLLKIMVCFSSRIWSYWCSITILWNNQKFWTCRSFWKPLSILYLHYRFLHILQPFSLRKQAYSIYWNFTTKKWKFSDKKFWYFLYIFAHNTDGWYSLEPPRRGGSNEYLKSMFLSRNKKNNVYPCKPQFTI